MKSQPFGRHTLTLLVLAGPLSKTIYASGRGSTHIPVKSRHIVPQYLKSRKGRLISQCRGVVFRVSEQNTALSSGLFIRNNLACFSIITSKGDGPQCGPPLNRIVLRTNGKRFVCIDLCG